MRLCIATNNRHKIEEMKALLPSGKFEFISLQDIGCLEELPETQSTIEGNSWQKANYVWENYNISCFADDSGLETEALNGEPGVDSAFYSGTREANKNIELLLKNLLPHSNRKARFRTVITLILNGEINSFEGIVKGTILFEKKGSQGFGYDPVFVPEGFNKTFAEMSLTEKNPISHRGLAVQKLINFLNTI